MLRILFVKKSISTVFIKSGLLLFSDFIFFYFSEVCHFLQFIFGGTGLRQGLLLAKFSLVYPVIDFISGILWLNTLEEAGKRNEQQASN
jgi:hypothetical protein